MLEETLKQEFDERYLKAFRAWDTFLLEADKDLKFVTGDAWDAREKAYLKQNRREALNWNKTRRIIKLVTGYQRKNRLGWQVEATGSQKTQGVDDHSSDQYSQLLQHVMKNCHGYNTMSDCFEQGPLKTGINLCEIGLDYTYDLVSGDVNLFRVPYNKFLLDPDMFRRDLSDCGYILRREWVTKKQAKSLMPDKASEIEKLHSYESDNKFTFALKSQGAKHRVRWDEYWRRDTERKSIVIDPQSGAWKVWPKDKAALQQFMQFNPGMVIKTVYKPTVKLTVFLEGQVFYDGPDPLGIGDYPFVPLLGDWNPEHYEYKRKLSSMVRDIRDPQSELNKRRSKILDIMDSQINSGWEAEEDAVVNPKDMYQSGQGKVIWYKKGALSGGQARKIQPPQIPQGLFQFQDLMDKDMMEIAGANNELFGIADKDQTQTPGLLAKLRQSQGLTTLQDLFDNYRLAKSQLGTKLLKVIQRTYTPDKVQKVLGEAPSQEFYSRNFNEYRIFCTEGVLTDSQRQMYYSELIQLKNAGAPIPWAAIIEAAPLQNKDDLQKVVDQQEKQAAQDQQDQKQMENYQIQAMIAKTREDVAGAVEKTAQAHDQRALATLNQIKAMKEMQGMDMDRLKTLADALSVMRNMQQQAAPKQQLMTQR